MHPRNFSAGRSRPPRPGPGSACVPGHEVPELFDAFMKKFPSSSLHLVTGTIPLGVMPQTYGHRTLFVGDAAGFAKPTSGGGVYTGVRSARHAAAVAAEACEEDRFRRFRSCPATNEMAGGFRQGTALGFRLFSMRQHMTGQDTDDLIRALDTPDIRRIIEEYGDMDRPSAVVKKLLLRPGMLQARKTTRQTGLKSLF